MNQSRQSRFVAALIALFGMLFMQLAVASYACPGMQTGQSDMSAAATDQAMPGCHGMDKVQPNLCHANEQAGKQSLDKPELPHVQPFMAAALALVFHDIEPASGLASAQPASLLLTRSTAPPLSIRNCCFRI